MKNGKVFLILQNGYVKGFYKERQLLDINTFGKIDIVEAEVVSNALRLPNCVLGIYPNAFKGINVRKVILPLSVSDLKPFSLVGFKELVLLDRNTLRNISRGENWDYGIKQITPCTKTRKFLYLALGII